MQINKSERTNKYLFFISTVGSFIAILIYNVFTPLMSDDLLFNASLYHNFGDILIDEYHQYMTWTGRSVLQIIMKIFSIAPKWVFNISNSICFVVLILLIYYHTTRDRKEKKFNIIIYLFILIMVWNFSVEFDQTILWLGGACNYLWGTTIILGLITCNRALLDYPRNIKHPILLSLGLGVWGILAGWCNENTSGGGLLIMLCMLGISYFTIKKVPIYMITSIFGMITGLIFLVSAPGNKIRASYAIINEEHTGIMVYVSRFLKIMKNIDHNMMIYLVIIIILFVYFINKQKRVKEFIDAFVYLLASLASSFVLVFTPEPMPRAYFGANIFMLISCVILIGKISKDDGVLYSIGKGVVIAASVWMAFSYMENGANLIRICREIESREEYVEEQKQKGNYNLVVDPIDEQFKTEYSFVYDNELSKDKDYWINKVYCQRYGLQSICIKEDE